MKTSKFLQFVIFFVALWASLNLFIGTNKQDPQSAPTTDIEISAIKQKFSLGSIVQVKITNNKEANLEPRKDCPSEPLDVYKWKNGEW